MNLQGKAPTKPYMTAESQSTSLLITGLLQASRSFDGMPGRRKAPARSHVIKSCLREKDLRERRLDEES
jgi:hypothetical protein